MTARIGERLHALDGVRALAASLIVVHHLGIASAANMLFQSGHVAASSLLAGLTAGGVELFFVLSGVVLARPYLRYGKRIRASNFYLRRAKRLFPPFLVSWLLSGLAVYLASRYPTWWSRTANLPAFDAIEWVKQIGIVNLGVKPYNFAWWSLSIEVAFYLLFPLALPLFRHLSASGFALFSLIAATAGFSVFCYIVPLFPVQILNQLAVYASCFCAGLILATNDISSQSRRALAACGFLWILCAAFTGHLNPHVGWGLLAFAFVSAAIGCRTLKNFLSAPLLVWLGERSYSIFLTHFAVIALVCLGVSSVTQSKGAAYYVATRIVSAPLLILTGMILFHCVERRFAKNLATADFFWPWSVRLSDVSELPGFAPVPPAHRINTH